MLKKVILWTVYILITISCSANHPQNTIDKKALKNSFF